MYDRDEKKKKTGMVTEHSIYEGGAPGGERVRGGGGDNPQQMRPARRPW